jgi:hypothetical protein
LRSFEDEVDESSEEEVEENSSSLNSEDEDEDEDESDEDESLLADEFFLAIITYLFNILYYNIQYIILY